MALALGPAPAWAEPANVAAAVANTAARSEANVKLDEGRKPAEVLGFFGLEQGMRVIDMFGANRYWAEIMAPAVGPQGQVTVWQPTQFINDEAQGQVRRVCRQAAANVALISSPFEDAADRHQRHTTS